MYHCETFSGEEVRTILDQAGYPRDALDRQLAQNMSFDTADGLPGEFVERERVIPASEIKVGLEVEAFGRVADHCHGEQWYECDAAPDLVEIVGLAGSLLRALKGMADHAQQAGPGLSYQFFRPSHMMDGKDCWRDSARYDGLKQALALECPQSWQGVNVMTNRAATHFNVGIDWETPAGVAVLSFFNNLGPCVSDVLQGRHGVPCGGQLSPWQGWADSRRFPSPHLWWNSTHDLRTFFESIPRLIQPGSEGEPEVIPDRSLMSGRMEAKFHLGTIWLLARPKIAPDGTRYIELRILGSIDPRTEVFRSIVVDLYELVNAVRKATVNGLLKSDASDLLSDLRKGGFSYLPEQLLTQEDWDRTNSWGGRSATMAA